jgi:flagellin-like protein
MNKKGLASIVATLLLTAMAVAIAAIVFSWGKGIVVNLAPPVDCSGVNFRAEIFSQSGIYHLAVVNTGTVRLESFVIKVIDKGEIEIYEEIDGAIEAGATEDFVLAKGYDGKFIVVPGISDDAEDADSFARCGDEYSYEVEV